MLLIELVMVLEEEKKRRTVKILPKPLSVPNRSQEVVLSSTVSTSHR